MAAIGDASTQVSSDSKAETREPWLDRLLALADDDQPESRRIKLDALRLVLVASLILEFSQIYLGPGRPSIAHLWGAFVLSMAALLCVSHRLERLATLIALAVTLTIVVRGFPGGPNHYMLPLLVFLMLSILNLEQEAEQRLALQGVRWLTAIVLFLTGFQKIVYGTYFQGDFLGWMIAKSERFSQVFAYVLSAEELTRLQALDGSDFGNEAYRPRSLIVLAMSNLVYIIELVAPVFLILKRTRTVALLGTVIFIVMVEAGAREYYFGFLFAGLLLTFAARNWIRWLVPVVLALAALSLAYRLWHLPL